MRQVVANARENRETVIRSADVNSPCRVGKGAGPAPPARRLIEPGPARGRAVRITAAFLTATFLASAVLGSILTSEMDGRRTQRPDGSGKPRRREIGAA